MSKLEELIQELCPNGVEYKSLNNVCDKIYAGGTPSTSNEDYYDGEIPWIRSGEINFNSIYKAERNITELGLTNSSAKWIESKSVVMAMTGATVARSAVTEIDLTANQSVCALVPNRVKINYKFLYYCISNMYSLLKSKGQGALTSLNLQMIKEVRVPVPPLEVQSEIVRILDNFTLLTAELRAELRAELTARKEQYQYYRSVLFEKKEYKKYKLKEICDIYLGLTYTPTYVEEGVKFISSKNISNDYLDLNDVKFISEEEYEKSTNNAKPKKGDILFTRVGSNLGHPVIVDTDEELCIFVSVGYVRVDDRIILNSYMKHWMNTSYFWKQVESKVKNAPKANLNSSWMREFEIYIPSLEEQQKIVDILDKFEEYCIDISKGLPAEIELRQQQYEYYRDKLLTFKELK